MLLGARAHDFGKLPVEELAKKIQEKKIAYIQLALAKAIAGIDDPAGILNPGLASYFRDVFYKRDIKISVLGCYLNYAHPDQEQRRKNIEVFKQHIRFARDFGCSVIGTETGSINADYSCNFENQGDKAFQILYESLQELVDEAEKFGVFVGIEGVTSHIISTPTRMKQMLDKIDSPHLQVIFDPVNLLSIENYENQDKIIEESFDLFGDKIAIIHAKDFIIKDNELHQLAPGNGLLNYKLLCKLIKKRKPYIEILMEEMSESIISESMAYIEKCYKLE
ncbi:MAG: sugar phosphate isomerase/epimerase [Deferribacteres bacterium]|nr:sugar phosphate isomerase/epimerase [candidate division KSB1 bacterium]MCB9501065.1 sugar phosphate isomerase/epimerase [Deferribacteres bacterium]